MDRNQMEPHIIPIGVWSLSARRAWIEIQNGGRVRSVRGVALRKESVDRNFINVARAADRILSLSARRAWIEI